MSLYPLHAINLNMLQVQGRSDIFLYLEIIKKIVSIGPLLLGIFVNIYWMLIGSIITGIISFFLNSFYTGKRLDYSSWMQLKDVMPSYLLSVLIAFPVYFLKYIPINYWCVLFFQILLATMIFLFACRYHEFEEYCELRQMFNSMLYKFKISFIQK